jgi:hypothetical protein
MNLFNLNKKSFYALLLTFLMSAMLPACSSSEEESGGDTNMECDANDTQKECADDIM